LVSWLLFLLSFLAIYSAMHALVFWGVHPLLAGHPWLPGIVAAWMAAMVVAPVCVRLLDRLDLPLPARILAWVAYSWMGFLFIAFVLFLLVALWHLFTQLLGQLLPAAAQLTVHRPAAAALVLLCVLALGIYGFYEADDLRIETVRLESAKLPPGVAKVRIAQVSDLHLGLLHREESLAPIVARLEQLSPDLLVATGDIVDAQIDHLDGLSGLWSRLHPPLGKYAVTGNHEFYAGLEQSLDYLRRSGFTVLRNATAAPADYLRVVGVDDPAGGHPAGEEDLLRQPGGEQFTVLLKHRPRLATDAPPAFDLQLSGHAHRGQIFPFNLLTGLFYPMQNGPYPLAGGSVLYASRGTGTWGPPMRLLSPPEITLFEIVRQP